MRLNGLGMLKRSSKVYYRYRGRHHSIMAVYRRLVLSRMGRKNHYLYSSVVEAHYHNQIVFSESLLVKTRLPVRQPLVPTVVPKHTPSQHYPYAAMAQAYKQFVGPNHGLDSKQNQ